MRFKKTRDVLDHVRRFHEEVSSCCENVAGKTDRKRIKILLDYIAAREKDLAHAVSKFTEEASSQVLDTWYQYTTDDTKIQQAMESELKPDMTPDDVIRVTMEIADHLISLYQGMVEAADTDDLKDLFQNLLDREQNGKKKLARNLQMFTDL